MSTITKEFTKEQLIEDLKSSTQNASGMFEISEDTICALMSMIYAAPQLPQPAVPDIATVETTYPDVQTNWQDAKMYAEGWNAYRAAMLQGAEPVKKAYKLNSPVIPDGWVLVPVEPTEDMIVEGFESEPDESFSDEKEWEAYDAMSRCQQAAHRATLCWAAMIAAAPKPEVK